MAAREVTVSKRMIPNTMPTLILSPPVRTEHSVDRARRLHTTFESINQVEKEAIGPGPVNGFDIGCLGPRPLVTCLSCGRHRECLCKLTRLHVPELNRRVDAAGQQKAIVAREDEPVDVKLVPLQREKFFSSLHVPHQCLDVHISVLLWIESNVTCRDQFSVVTEGDCARGGSDARRADHRHTSDFPPSGSVPELNHRITE